MVSNAVVRFLVLALLLAVPGSRAAVEAQSGGQDSKPGSYIKFKRYSAEEDAKVLKLFDGLRVADVSDAMDIVGLQDVGLMDPAVHALWRDTEDSTHRFTGIAVTVRYVPTNKRPGKMSAEEFKRWEGQWYTDVSPEPFVNLLRAGSVIVIDAGEDGDTGSIGSNNILVWKTRGAVGVVTSGGARDTDEIIKQKVPLYLKRLGRGIRPGRNEVESVDQPIMCGGVLVRPGDVIVADGDGVVVVPREQAEAVALAARQILESDKEGRRRLYERLGMPIDKTVTPRKP
jgi:regulator of RNase E activity RraA